MAKKLTAALVKQKGEKSVLNFYKHWGFMIAKNKENESSPDLSTIFNIEKGTIKASDHFVGLFPYCRGERHELTLDSDENFSVRLVE